MRTKLEATALRVGREGRVRHGGELRRGCPRSLPGAEDGRESREEADHSGGTNIEPAKRLTV
jgi:hypothetical protein